MSDKSQDAVIIFPASNSEGKSNKTDFTIIGGSNDQQKSSEVFQSGNIQQFGEVEKNVSLQQKSLLKQQFPRQAEEVRDDEEELSIFGVEEQKSNTLNQQQQLQAFQQSITSSEIKALENKKLLELSKPVLDQFKYFIRCIQILWQQAKQEWVKRHLLMLFQRKGHNKTSELQDRVLLKFRRYKVLSVKIIHQSGQIQESQIVLNLKFIDTPGYRDSYSLKAWYKMIRNYVIESVVINHTILKLQSYENWYNKAYESKDNFQRSFLTTHDERVHVCLYFFSGPRIKVEDLQILKRLSKLVNIIPILAKGDCYTIEEVKVIKQNFNNQLIDYQIEIFDYSFSQIQDEVLKAQLEGGPFGPSPPFLMVSSIDQYQTENGKVVLGRKFAWGVCDISNPNHSDFYILQKLLIGHFSTDLIKLTEFIYQKFLKKQQEKKKKYYLDNLIQQVFEEIKIIGNILQQIYPSIIVIPEV